MEDKMKFVYTNGQNKDFIALCRMLDQYLNAVAGGEEKRAYYLPFNKMDDIHDVVLAYDHDEAAGCAGFKPYENDTAEVKRVFVREDYRGRGIAKQLINEVEKQAKKKGFKKLILETGANMPEAYGLYKKLGYEIMENYGQYKNMNQSICMQKLLQSVKRPSDGL